MEKTGDVNVSGNKWQRLVRWHKGKKESEGDGEDGAKDEGKPNIALDLKLKVK